MLMEYKQATAQSGPIEYCAKKEVSAYRNLIRYCSLVLPYFLIVHLREKNDFKEEVQ